MPKFITTFAKKITCVVEASSQEEAEQACATHCAASDVDTWDSDAWQFKMVEVHPTREPDLNPDMGVWNGECLAYEDYITQLENANVNELAPAPDFEPERD